MYSYLETTVSQVSLNNNYFLQWILCLVTFCLSATIWNKKTKLSRTTELVEVFPGPKRYWLFGSIVDLATLVYNPTKKVLRLHEDMADKYGWIYKTWIFNHPVIVLSDTETAIKLYNDGSLPGKSTCVYDTAKAVGGEGLVALPPEVHAKRRKQWMPSFTRKQVEMSVKFFREQAIRLCDELKVYERGGNPFDLVELSVGCTFKASCYSAFGEEYMAKLPDSVGREHIHDLHTVGLNMTARIFKPWLQINDYFFLHCTQMGRETLRCSKRANLLTQRAVRERKKYLENAEKEKKPQSSEDFKCFLNHMVELMKDGQLTEKEVIQEMNIFITGGYDTSGITLCYTLYLLSLYPEHQEKVLDELREMVPSEHWNSPKNYKIDGASTKQMKYLELCIKETLRLYPIIPVSPRSTTQDVVLPDGRIIPAGVDVWVLLRKIQRDPKYFSNPEKFMPERHLQPNPAFMPFALGSRNCIGQVYAMYEMKVILAYLLMTYKWETTEKEGLEPIFQALLVPENGISFKINRRNC